VEERRMRAPIVNYQPLKWLAFIARAGGLHGNVQ
jgi:hypothetical protein